MRIQQSFKKNQEPKVAILLATFNGEAFIQCQIDCILNQKGISPTIYVSDDKSSDNTLSILSRISEIYSDLKIVSKDIRFGSASANFFYLIKSVTIDDYDYIAFADQDDIWDDDKIVSAITEMNFTESDAYSSDVIAFWPNTLKKKLVIKSRSQTGIDHWFESPGPGCSQVFSCNSFKIFQNFIKQSDFNLEQIDYHDWLVYAFYKHRGFKWHISDNPKMLYVQHPNNYMGANLGFRASVYRLKLIKMKWLRTQVNLIYHVVSGDNKQLMQPFFMFSNMFSLRRNKKESFFLYLMYLLRVL